MNPPSSELARNKGRNGVEQADEKLNDSSDADQGDAAVVADEKDSKPTDRQITTAIPFGPPAVETKGATCSPAAHYCVIILIINAPPSGRGWKNAIGPGVHFLCLVLRMKREGGWIDSCARDRLD
jgi:hypothetical protein